MLNPHSAGVLIHPDYTIERDGVVCSHCQHVYHVGPKQDPAEIGGFCTGCMELICKSCAHARSMGGPCIPWEKQMDLIEAAVEKQRAIASWF